MCADTLHQGNSEARSMPCVDSLNKPRKVARTAQARGQVEASRGRLSPPERSRRWGYLTRPLDQSAGFRRRGGRDGVGPDEVIGDEAAKHFAQQFLDRPAPMLAGDRLVKLPPLAFDSQNTHPTSAMPFELASDCRVRCDQTGGSPAPRRRNRIRVFRSDS